MSRPIKTQCVGGIISSGIFHCVYILLTPRVGETRKAAKSPKLKIKELRIKNRKSEIKILKNHSENEFVTDVAYNET